MHSVGFSDVDPSGSVVAVVNDYVFGFVVESSVVVSLMNFCVCGTFSLACVSSTDITIFTFCTTLLESISTLWLFLLCILFCLYFVTYHTFIHLRFSLKSLLYSWLTKIM